MSLQIHLYSYNSILTSVHDLSWPVASMLAGSHQTHSKKVCIVVLMDMYLFFIYYWSIVDLQYCVSFRCITKWFSFTCIYILLQILFPYRLSQNIEYSPLCYMVSPWLSILYVVVWIHYFQTPHLSLSPIFPLQKICFLYLWDCFYFVSKLICIIFLDSTYKWYHITFVFLGMSYFT